MPNLLEDTAAAHFLQDSTEPRRRFLTQRGEDAEAQRKKFSDRVWHHQNPRCAFALKSSALVFLRWGRAASLQPRKKVKMNCPPARFALGFIHYG
jgi:hypothetical protein